MFPNEERKPAEEGSDGDGGHDHQQRHAASLHGGRVPCPQLLVELGELEQQTEALRDCMMADPGYYGDMLPDEGEADDEKKDTEASRSDSKAKPSEPAPAAPAKQSRAAAAVTGA